MRIEIKNDLYDIAERVKKIDERYRIFFDTKLQKFVVTVGALTAAVLPYEELDARTLAYLSYTRFENAERVAQDVDESNARLHENAVRSAQDELEDEFSHRLRVTETEFVHGSFSSRQNKR